VPLAAHAYLGAYNRLYAMECDLETPLTEVLTQETVQKSR